MITRGHHSESHVTSIPMRERKSNMIHTGSRRITSAATMTSSKKIQNPTRNIMKKNWFLVIHDRHTITTAKKYDLEVR